LFERGTKFSNRLYENWIRPISQMLPLTTHITSGFKFLDKFKYGGYSLFKL